MLRELEVGNDKPFKTYEKMFFGDPADKASQKFRVPRNTSRVRNF